MSDEQKAAVLTDGQNDIQDEMDLSIAGVDGIDQVPDYVDPETGELLDGADLGQPRPDDQAELDRLVAGQALPQFARILNAIDRRKQKIDDFKKAEMGRIKNSCQAKLDQLEKSRSAMLRQAKHIVERALPKKSDGSFATKSLDYPGLGMFSLRSETPALIETDWQNYDDDEKTDCANDCPELFSTEIKPDRTAIRKKLNAGGTVSGFSISTDPVRTYVNYKQKG